jgi:hypothetical protein
MAVTTADSGKEPQSASGLALYARILAWGATPPAKRSRGLHWYEVPAAMDATAVP